MSLSVRITPLRPGVETISVSSRSPFSGDDRSPLAVELGAAERRSPASSGTAELRNCRGQEPRNCRVRELGNCGTQELPRSGTQELPSSGTEELRNSGTAGSRSSRAATFRDRAGRVWGRRWVHCLCRRSDLAVRAAAAAGGGSNHTHETFGLSHLAPGRSINSTVHLSGRGPVALPQLGAISRLTSSGTARGDPHDRRRPPAPRPLRAVLAQARASAAPAALYSEQTKCTACDCSTLAGPGRAPPRRLGGPLHAPAARTASPREAGPSAHLPKALSGGGRRRRGARCAARSPRRVAD